MNGVFVTEHTEICISLFQSRLSIFEDIHTINLFRFDIQRKWRDWFLVAALCHFVMKGSRNSRFYIFWNRLCITLKLKEIMHRRSSSKYSSYSWYLDRSGWIFSYSRVKLLPALVGCTSKVIKYRTEYSTLVTSLKPIEWQIETAFVENAVEKFNLKKVK